MACIIERPAPQQLFDRYLNMFSTTVLNGAPVIPESNEWYVTSLNYATAEEFYSIAEQQWKERDPRYACCDNLLKMAAADGVFPYDASFATGYVEISGAAGSVLPNSLQITIGADTYATINPLPGTMPTAGKFVTRVSAIEPGSQGNGKTAETGTLVNAIPGVNSTVKVFGGNFCGGQEQEDCEAFRARYIERQKFSPRPNAAWVEQQLLAWPCVTRVCARGGTCCTLDEPCSCANCKKSLDYYVFMEGTFDCGIPPQCAIDEIQTHIFGEHPGYGEGLAPVGMCGTLHVATPVIFDIVISDFGCIDDGAKAEIQNRIGELFRTLCPSGELTTRQINFVVASVLGSDSPFAVDLYPRDQNLVNPLPGGCNCGYEMLCDVMPCLGVVSFNDPESMPSACA